MPVITSPSACIEADPSQIAKVMLMPGDPLRAKKVADTYLTDTVCFNTVRNMLGFTGTYKGRRISVMGSGMGVPSATLYVHELFTFYGVETVLRIGSAGGIGEDVKLRDLVIAMTASTNSNYVMQYQFPGQLSPQADYKLLRTAVELAEKKGINVRVGSVFTADMFYNKNDAAAGQYRDMGLLAVEMETAGIYWEAMASKKRALSLLTISDHIFTGEGLSAEDRQNSFTDMMEVALDTAWSAAE
jgi:purine-nucleoside phosphorylase